MANKIVRFYATDGTAIDVRMVDNGDGTYSPAASLTAGSAIIGAVNLIDTAGTNKAVVDSHGTQAAGLYTSGGTAIAGATPGSSGVAAALGLVTTNQPLVFNGTTWEPMRAANKVLSSGPVAITAGTPVTVYTPAAGKRVRVLKFQLSNSVSGAVIIKDNGVELIRTSTQTGNNGQFQDIGPIGLLQAATGTPLQLDVSATGSVQGYVMFCEE